MRKLLAALYEQAQHHVHGYDLMMLTGLSSGSLYPLLIRMVEKDLIDTEWLESSYPNQTARHAYGLTADGLSLARKWYRTHWAFGMTGAAA